MPGTATHTFGRTPGQSARGALLLAVLGGAAVWGLGRLLFAPRSPFEPVLRGLGIPEWAIPAAGGAVSLALGLLGLRWSLRGAPRFRVTDQGLDITGPLGSYRVDWANLEQAGEAAGGALGLRLRSREALLATHQGSSRQREWLRTQEPFGDWDLLFPAAELGVPVAQALGWLREAANQQGF
jgi:hypothetical protein